MLLRLDDGSIDEELLVTILEALHELEHEREACLARARHGARLLLEELGAQIPAQTAQEDVATSPEGSTHAALGRSRRPQ